MAKAIAPPPGHELGGKKPKIKSKADVATAVAVLSWMDSVRKAVDAEITPQIDALREEQTKRLCLEVEGETVGFDARSRQLTECIEAFVLSHPEKVFEGETKTATFASGSVSLKDKAPWLQFAEGVSKKTVIAELCAESELIPKISAWLKRLGLRPWLKLTPELDSQALTSAAKEQAITADELAEYGLSFSGGTNVTIKPADYRAATEPTGGG